MTNEKGWPERVWLQRETDWYDHPNLQMPFPQEGTTWAAERVFDADVEYVRARELADREATIERLEAGLELIAYHDDIVYLSCPSTPFCSPGLRHDADCAVAVAWAALGEGD